MAATPSSSRRSLNTRGVSARKSGQRASSAGSPPNSEPPLKKRRYVPGGPGGGGRYVDPDGKETLVGGGGPGGYNYVGPRGRVGRENAANGVQPVAYTPRPRRESRRERAPARPRFSSAAAAAAAVVHGDGFKPREERGWEEFHQDLDIEARFLVFSSYEVDGIKKPTPTSSFDTPDGGSRGRVGQMENGDIQSDGRRTPSAHEQRYSISPSAADTGSRRRPGRPPRRADSMLKGIGTPEMPKVIPLPGFNPREKLTLPKPSFRSVDPFEKFEEKDINSINYVDKSMAHIGYQESEIYLRPEHSLVRVTEGNIEDDLDLTFGTKNDSDVNPAIGGSGFGRVEYDMDEQDTNWLETVNEQRQVEQVQPIKPAIFEATMTKIEKEWYALEKRIPKPNPKPPQTQRPRSSSAAAVNGELAVPEEEQDSKCAICNDGDCENTNAIVFCDGCDLAVHQECYGVPFIPEGQWLCRKCQLIGRGMPTCIFCPNTDGAFKQTNASRWSHLLCAIWIPEVSIGNTTFMEPVMDVEKVPKQRWRLTCYICRQKMGACIQCGNKNCYIAFHVTCARRARLFLKMKSTHGGPASLDASVLKAFCDKHVPADWRREQDTDNAIIDAMDHYRRSMRGRLWADSQQSALTTMPAPSQDPFAADSVEEPSNPKVTLKLGANGRNRNQPPKVVWRLPSGAPVIPQTVYHSIESALTRSTVAKRKEFAAEMCKYWTLKREARRGAALLKRLQLQMETFTSMEITRRNFVGMGAAGNVRLQRRIDFADTLLEDVDKLRQMCVHIKEREHQKREDAFMLRNVVDTIYFPIGPLLVPILQKAQSLDGKGTFQQEFSVIGDKLSKRFYTSVNDFSRDFGAVLSDAVSLSNVADAPEAALTSGESPSKAMISDLKQKKALAKRILKAAQKPLQEAMSKESELCRKPVEQELKNLDNLLKNGVPSRRGSTDELPLKTNGHNHDEDADAEGEDDPDVQMNGLTNGEIDPAISELSHKLSNGLNGHDHHVSDMGNSTHSKDGSAGKDQPPTPPLSTGGETYSLSQGGAPWYMEAFSPRGTAVSEEQWTGVRGMSEDLSDMDEDELSELVDADELKHAMAAGKKLQPSPMTMTVAAAKKRKAALARKRRR